MPQDIKCNLLLLDPYGIYKNPGYKILAQYIVVIEKGITERDTERDQRPLILCG